MAGQFIGHCLLPPVRNASQHAPPWARCSSPAFRQCFASSDTYSERKTAGISSRESKPCRKHRYNFAPPSRATGTTCVSRVSAATLVMGEFSRRSRNLSGDCISWAHEQRRWWHDERTSGHACGTHSQVRGCGKPDLPSLGSCMYAAVHSHSIAEPSVRSKSSLTSACSAPSKAVVESRDIPEWVPACIIQHSITWFTQRRVADCFFLLAVTPTSLYDG